MLLKGRRHRRPFALLDCDRAIRVKLAGRLSSADILCG
jgi:hypothetical protein